METGRARIDEQMQEAVQPTTSFAAPQFQAPQFQAPPTQPLAAPPPVSEPPPASGAGNVEQIRDILFGVQMRDYERRFSNLEARLTQEAAMLRDDIRARFDALELAMRQQFNALSESLGNERDNRTGAVNKVNDDVRILRDDAADRRALAAMFTEMARRLDAGQEINGSGHSGNASNSGGTEANHGHPPSDTQ